MSALAVIEMDVEKFLKGTATDAEKFTVAFERCFKKSPAALQTVENFINEVAPVITLAVGMVDPVLEPEVAAGLAVAETLVGALQASATAAVTGTSLVTCLQNFSTTVPALLKGVAIKNPALQATITKLVNLVVGEVTVLIPAVQSWVAQIKAAQVA